MHSQPWLPHICMHLPDVHHGVAAGMSKFLTDRLCMFKIHYVSFNQMTAPCCLQAEAFHPCGVRFYFSTGRLHGMELAATPAFPMFHGNCNTCAQCGDSTLACKHNLGQILDQPVRHIQRCSLSLIPPTFCIGGKFEVRFTSSQT